MASPPKPSRDKVFQGQLVENGGNLRLVGVESSLVAFLEQVLDLFGEERSPFSVRLFQ